MMHTVALTVRPEWRTDKGPRRGARRLPFDEAP